MDPALAVTDAPTCEAFQFKSYVEQGCLERFLVHQSVRRQLPPGVETRVAMAPMALFNSPWGSVVQHLWGGAGKQLRGAAFEDAMIGLGLRSDDPHRKRTRKLQRLMPRAHEVEEFDC